MTHRAAIGLMCIAVICFTILDSTAKYLGEFVGMPVEQVLWLRFLTHLIFLGVLYRPKGFIKGLKSAVPKTQILRTIAMVLTTAFNFLALKYLQLDQTITIFFLSPLLVAAIAGPMLGEWLKPNQLLVVFIGFCGVLIVMRPGFGGIHWAVIFSLASALALAFYNVLTRYASHYDNNRTNQIFSPIGGAILLTPIALYNWQMPESPMVWLLMLSLGVTGGLGHWFLITAHRFAPAPLLAPFIYTGIITMPIIGYLVFDDRPSPFTALGAAIVIGSGLYLWYQEHGKSDPEDPGNIPR